MKTRETLILLGALASLAPSAMAAKIHSAAGSTSASFLKLGIGPRAEGMAGAYAAVSDDASAMYWNPGGLTQIKGHEVSFMHNEHFQGLNQESLSAAYGLRNGHVLGLQVNTLYTPKDFERRSGLNEDDPINPLTESEGLFRAYDASLAVGYAARLSPALSLGGATKFIRQTIDDSSASGYAVDLGVHWKSLDSPFSLGAAVQNLGPGMAFESKSFPLPLNFKVGGATTFFEEKLLMALDLNQPIDNYLSSNLGFEYRWNKSLALRTGYRYRLYGNELGAVSGVAAGLGFMIRNFGIDYAFHPLSDLGNTHQLSLTMRWAKSAVSETPVSLAPSPPPSEKIYELKSQAKAVQVSAQNTRWEILLTGPEECAVSRIILNAKGQNTENVRALLKEGTTSDPGWRVYKGYKFEMPTTLTVTQSGIRFEVSKEWLEKEGKDPKAVTAQAFSQGQSIPTEVWVMEETPKAWSFRANTGNFQEFVIGVKP